MVTSLRMLPDGDLAVGGWFSQLDGVTSVSLGRLATTCPPRVIRGATACVGPSGQPVLLSAADLPWTGAVFASRATGFASGSLGVAIVGLSALAVPLGAIHPSGLPNCHLLATTECVSLVLPVAGAATLDLAIPNSPVFAGVVLEQQMMQLGISAQATLTSLSSSNALTFTIGTF
jgi:hypothetical protein